MRGGSPPLQHEGRSLSLPVACAAGATSSIPDATSTSLLVRRAPSLSYNAALEVSTAAPPPPRDAGAERADFAGALAAPRAVAASPLTLLGMAEPLAGPLAPDGPLPTVLSSGTTSSQHRSASPVPVEPTRELSPSPDLKRNLNIAELQRLSNTAPAKPAPTSRTAAGSKRPPPCLRTAPHLPPWTAERLGPLLYAARSAA